MEPELGALLAALLLFTGSERSQRVAERAGYNLASTCVTLFLDRVAVYTEPMDAGELQQQRSAKQGAALDRSVWIAAVNLVLSHEERSIETALVHKLKSAKNSAASIYKDRADSARVPAATCLGPRLTLTWQGHLAAYLGRLHVDLAGLNYYQAPSRCAC